MTTSKPPPTAPARGRQAASKPLASVTTSTASTRAKQALGSTKASERIGRSTASSTLRTDVKQSVKPAKASVPRINKSTSALSHTEATPAPKAPTPIPDSKDSTNAPSESTVPKTTESTDPLENNLLEPTNDKPSATLPAQPQNSSDKPTPVPTSDPLQVASQLYPWLYMTSTLDACFQTAEKTAKKDLETRAQHLAESESEVADQKTRFQAERAIEFYDTLSVDAFAETAPRIMQAFLAHGDACERVETEAMQVAMDPAKTLTEEEEDEDWDAPLRVYVDMLDTLEQLHAEALELESSIVKLTSSLTPHVEVEVEPNGNNEKGTEDEPNSANRGRTDDTPAGPNADANIESGAQAQILGVFKACLPVLRARIANLTMAQELVDGARENASISLRMESLGMLD